MTTLVKEAAATAEAAADVSGRGEGGNGGGGNGGGRGDAECRIIHGDAAESLSALPDKSVRCVCTDPPYGLGIARQYWGRSACG